ncbi:MAG TPA: phytanoyl-CoA dioxygenase family protein [Mycobacteriales bacterium]|jgi:ectoine hydroxylase-related dioxygenase (phytanoyl-CoA dioxygenase family)|nr:phytanoyl-CoA dioxygenase family protein [Mycobacteriales bacterium]
MLDDTQLESYRENGFILVKGLLSKEEAKAYRAESHTLIERLGRTDADDPTWGSARELGGAGKTSLQHCHDVQFQSAAFTRLIVDDRVTGVIADIIGSPNVQLHHTKMFVKPPAKGSPFPMHQDYPYFPHTTGTMGAVILHFDDAPEEKGCVRVVPGSYKNGPLEHVSDGGYHLPLDKWPLSAAVSCEAEAGDALFFSYMTVHGSGVNTSSEARTTLLIQYRDAADAPTVDTHRSRGQGMMLRGIDPTAGGPTAA